MKINFDFTQTYQGTPTTTPDATYHLTTTPPLSSPQPAQRIIDYQRND